MAYSYKDRAADPDEWWTPEQYAKAIKRSKLLAGKGAGHDKFLRQIVLWVDIEASRAWWSEMDTYKVGTVAQSESTMHTLSKRAPTSADFEEGTPFETIVTFAELWAKHKGDVNILKMALPEGFLQRRIVTMNYETLRAIIDQRTGHRLRWWGEFICAMWDQVQHKEYLRCQ
jgi:hypothetical protein